MTSTVLHNVIFTNASIELEEVQPNSNIKYKLSGYDQQQFYDLSWKLNDGLGFVAMKNGNGRITLFTNPIMENFKVSELKKKMKKPRKIIESFENNLSLILQQYSNQN